jgi:hypothetical protein
MEKIEYIELYMESVYVKRWEGPSYREPPTAIVKAPEPGPKALDRTSDFGSRLPCLRPEFGLSKLRTSNFEL